MTSGRVAIGAVTGAHGVKGLFKVKPFTDSPRDIAAYGPVQAGDRSLTLSVHGVTSNGLVIAAASEITDRDGAAALRGTRLEVDRSALPETEADEIYHTDLIGMSVETVDGERLGRIAALHDFGAGEIVEVRPPRGPTVMLPFDATFVPNIDLETRRVTVAPPDGLLDPPDPDRQVKKGGRNG